MVGRSYVQVGNSGNLSMPAIQNSGPPGLVHCAIWFRQRKRRNLDVKLFVALVDHLIGSVHRAEGHRQRAAGGVLKALTWCQDGLVPDDARTSDLLHFSNRIGDHPMAADQLYGVRTFVRDRNSVEKEPLALIGTGAAGIISGFDADPDTFCSRFGGRHSFNRHIIAQPARSGFSRVDKCARLRVESAHRRI
jgi:hypothetical protein